MALESIIIYRQAILNSLHVVSGSVQAAICFLGGAISGHSSIALYTLPFQPGQAQASHFPSQWHQGQTLALGDPQCVNTGRVNRELLQDNSI